MKQTRAWQNWEDLDARSSTVQWKLNDWLVYSGIFLQGMVTKVFSSDLGRFFLIKHYLKVCFDGFTRTGLTLTSVWVKTDILSNTQNINWYTFVILVLKTKILCRSVNPSKFNSFKKLSHKQRLYKRLLKRNFNFRLVLKLLDSISLTVD